MRVVGYIFLGLCVFVILASMQTTNIIQKRLVQSKKDFREQDQKRIYKGKPEKIPAAAVAKPSRIQPQDPAQFGMVVTPARNTPKTLDQWENKLAAEFDSHGVFENDKAQEILAQIQNDPVQYQQSMEDLDKNIAEAQVKLIEAPLNEQTEEKLQNLYKLRAIGKILEKKTLPQSGQPTIPPQ